MIKPNPLPPLALLREAMEYDPETGSLTWKVTRGKARKGQPVGYAEEDGYARTSFGGSKLRTARLCYALGHGRDPYPYEVDHVNRLRHDNRLANLRLAGRTEQLANRGVCPQTPIRITWPDGRGSVVVDSQETAARVLRCSRRSVLRALDRRSGAILWPGERPGLWVPSGVLVERVR